MHSRGYVHSTTRRMQQRKRRIPLNTILLPPLSPTLQENEVEILHNVVVSIKFQFKRSVFTNRGISTM